MRIISQSGRTDLNYDNCAIVADGNYIEARTTSQTYLMAKYSSEEKAEKVMKILHELFASGCKCVQFPKDEDVEVV